MSNQEEYKSFSQRIGKTPLKKELQIESIDEDLKNSLWNCFYLIILDKLPTHSPNFKSEYEKFIENLWFHFFKQPTEGIPRYSNGGIFPLKTNRKIKDWFQGAKWFEVYDLLEMVVQLNPNNFANTFIECCNKVLKKENAGYSFLNDLLVPVTNLEEVKEIEEALKVTSYTKLETVNIHLEEALKKLSDKNNPDYRNSIKESISAVESLASIITGNENATLGQALNEIKDSVNLHGALIQGFKNIYGYTSDADGIRHKLTESENLDLEDARYMIISCSAFINYLIIKADKAGITLKE